MQSFLCDRIATYVQVSGICINNGVSLGNGAGMELAYLLIGRFGDIRHGGRCVVMSIHLFDEAADFACCHTVTVELDDSGFKCIGVLCVSWDGFLGKQTIPIARDEDPQISIGSGECTHIGTVPTVPGVPAVRGVFLVSEEGRDLALEQTIDSGFKLLTENFVQWEILL